VLVFVSGVFWVGLLDSFSIVGVDVHHANNQQAQDSNNIVLQANKQSVDYKIMVQHDNNTIRHQEDIATNGTPDDVFWVGLLDFFSIVGVDGIVAGLSVVLLVYPLWLRHGHILTKAVGMGCLRGLNIL
jgi:hypothetical protein